MRLICGLIRLDGAAVAPATLAAMCAAMTHPGLAPAIAQRVDGPAGMAVLDFSPPPHATATLPTGPDGTWLAADIRLDQPRELAARFGLASTATDAVLALAALERFGADLPDGLHGDYAMAAWSPRERRLVLARDPFGARPLYWHHQPGRLFAFASLPKGLHGAGVAPAEPDAPALGRLLLRAYARGEDSPFRAIHRLRPGHTVSVGAEGIKQWQAWRPQEKAVGSWRSSAADAAATLRELVDAAVACRLPAVGAVAAHLSGGLDSSALTVLAARRLRGMGRRLHAYSMLAAPARDTCLCDERDFVAAVLEQEPDIAWQAFHLAPLGLDGFEDSDLPAEDPLSRPDADICAAAKSAGATLILSGAGGDEAATYNMGQLYPALLRQWRLAPLLADARARSTRQGRSVAGILARMLLYPMTPEVVKSLWRRRRGQPLPWQRQAGLLSFLAPTLRAAVTQSLPALPDFANRPEERIRLLTETYNAGRAERWSIIGARYGVALTFPLLDRRIVDFMLSLPLERLLDGGYARQPYRNAMSGILPEVVRLRETKFLPYPDLPLFLAAAKPELLARVNETRRASVSPGYFDFDAIAAAIRAIPEGSAALDAAVAMNSGGHVRAEVSLAVGGLRALNLVRHMDRFT